MSIKPKPADLVPQADVVAITGTALINHTLDGLLALCRSDALVMVLGQARRFHLPYSITARRSFPARVTMKTPRCARSLRARSSSRSKACGC
jgi:hypothetical protein